MLEYLKSPGKDHQWILTPVDERMMGAGSFHVSTCHRTDYLPIAKGNISLYNTEMSGHHLNQAVEPVSPGQRQPDCICPDQVQ